MPLALAFASAVRYHNCNIMYTEPSRVSIASLVNDFYTDIRRDSILAPIFDSAIGAD